MTGKGLRQAVVYLSIHRNGSICGFRCFKQGRILIGRSPDTDLQLNCENVSRRHAVVFVRNDGFILEDLGSTNGTFVHGERITRSCFTEQETVVVGAYKLRFRVITGSVARAEWQFSASLAEGIENEDTQEVMVPSALDSDGDPKVTINATADPSSSN
jgi:pSer/pThr/pTyr-binding forkhead associated (FHA) protein